MNESTRQTMFSSATNEWATPQEFFDKLNKIYNFTLDPCCTKETAKCSTFFTEKEDGLSQSWRGHQVSIKPRLVQIHPKDTLVACLIPARTDTKYWHDYCMKANKIMFVKGRLKFGDGTGSAPFPSAVVIFDGGEYNHTTPKMEAIDRQ